MSDSSSSVSSVDDNPKLLEKKDGTTPRNSIGNSQVNAVVPSLHKLGLHNVYIILVF
jgi:hypothetical protein